MFSVLTIRVSEKNASGEVVNHKNNTVYLITKKHLSALSPLLKAKSKYNEVEEQVAQVTGRSSSIDVDENKLVVISEHAVSSLQDDVVMKMLEIPLWCVPSSETEKLFSQNFSRQYVSFKHKSIVKWDQKQVLVDAINAKVHLNAVPDAKAKRGNVTSRQKSETQGIKNMVETTQSSLTMHKKETNLAKIGMMLNSMSIGELQNATVHYEGIKSAGAIIESGGNFYVPVGESIAGKLNISSINVKDDSAHSGACGYNVFKALCYPYQTWDEFKVTLGNVCKLALDAFNEDELADHNLMIWMAKCFAINVRLIWREKVEGLKSLILPFGNEDEEVRQYHTIHNCSMSHWALAIDGNNDFVLDAVKKYKPENFASHDQFGTGQLRSLTDVLSRITNEAFKKLEDHELFNFGLVKVKNDEEVKTRKESTLVNNNQVGVDDVVDSVRMMRTIKSIGGLRKYLEMKMMLDERDFTVSLDFVDIGMLYSLVNLSVYHITSLTTGNDSCEITFGVQLRDLRIKQTNATREREDLNIGMKLIDLYNKVFG